MSSRQSWSWVAVGSPAPGLLVVHATAALAAILCPRSLTCREQGIVSAAPGLGQSRRAALVAGDHHLPPSAVTFGACNRHSLLEVTQLFPEVQHLWDRPESLLKLLLRDGHRDTVAGKSCVPSQQGAVTNEQQMWDSWRIYK